MENVSHVLYITSKSDACLGCKQALELIDSEEWEERIIIQEVESLISEGAPLPIWLHGVPTLIELSTRRVDVGKYALEALESLKMTAGDDSPGGDAAGGHMSDEYDGSTPDDAFASNAGCDPESLNEGDKITAEDVEKLLKERQQAVSNEGDENPEYDV